MEKLNPLIGKPAIGSLRFNKRSEFDKFLKFIKFETKELKGKESGIGQSIKKFVPAAAGGFAAFGIGALLALRKRKDDPKFFESGIIPGKRPIQSTTPGNVRKTASKTDIRAVQRKNTKRRLDRTRSDKGFFNKYRPGYTKDIGTRIEEAKADPKKAEALKKSKINPTRSRITFSQEVTSDVIRKEKEIVKKFFTNQDSLVQKNAKLGDDFLKKLNEAIGKDNPLFKGDTIDDTLKKLGLPLDDVSKFEKKLQGGKFNIKDFFDIGKTVDKKVTTSTRGLTGSDIGMDFLNQRVFGGATADQIDDAILNFRSGKNQLNVDSFRRFTEGETISDPMKRVGQRRTSTISTNPVRSGALAKFFKRMRPGGVKFTTSRLRDFLPRGTTSLIGKTINNPFVKIPLFLYELFGAFSEGTQIVNLKNNIVTSLIDLGIAVNNIINADDPSKMRLFISEPSAPKFKSFQKERNRKIMRLKEAQNNQANNIIVPMNLDNEQQGGPLNIPNVSSSSSSSVAFNTDQLNIGDMVFLSKLSAG